MKLHTKLSASIVAASFSALLFMSSCSKEDALTPQPESAGLKDDANMRAGGETGTTIGGTAGGTINPNTLTEHNFPTTIDQPWKGKFPIWWYGTEYGTSSTQSLGNNQGRWVTPIAQPQPNVNTFITLKNYQHSSGSAHSDFRQLLANHKYRVTFYVSTNSVQEGLPGSLSVPSPYAKAVVAEVVSQSTNGLVNTQYHNKIISFAGRENQWIKETLEFTTTYAIKSTDLYFYGKSGDGVTKPTFVNVSVGKYAIEDLGKVN